MVELSGPAVGVGARYALSATKDVGTGSVEITDSRASDYVHMHLLMQAPFAVVTIR